MGLGGVCLHGCQFIWREANTYHRAALSALGLPLARRLGAWLSPGFGVVTHSLNLLGKLVFLHDPYSALLGRHLVNSPTVLFHPVMGRKRSTDSRVTTATVSERPPSVPPSMSQVAVSPFLFGTYTGRLSQT